MCIGRFGRSTTCGVWPSWREGGGGGGRVLMLAHPAVWHSSEGAVRAGGVAAGA